MTSIVQNHTDKGAALPIHICLDIEAAKELYIILCNVFPEQDVQAVLILNLIGQMRLALKNT